MSVRILTNSLSSNNHLVAHSAYQNHIRALLSGGVDLYEVRTDAQSRSRFMLPPVSEKALALHAKALLIDHDRVFVGSANLDPRSLRINTEMGLLVESDALNRTLRDAFAPDFASANAYDLETTDSGSLVWRSGSTVLTSPPDTGVMQRLEDWFLSRLPIEAEL